MKNWLATLALCWTVMGQQVRVIDGDTFVADLEIWPNMRVRERVRLLGVNAPEVKGPHKDEAEKAKEFTTQWLARGRFSVEVCKTDSFGRVLGRVFRGDDDLAAALLGAGMATEYRR